MQPILLCSVADVDQNDLGVRVAEELARYDKRGLNIGIKLISRSG
jgi:hypothetical protein